MMDAPSHPLFSPPPPLPPLLWASCAPPPPGLGQANPQRRCSNGPVLRPTYEYACTHTPDQATIKHACTALGQTPPNTQHQCTHHCYACMADRHPR